MSETATETKIEETKENFEELSIMLYDQAKDLKITTEGEYEYATTLGKSISDQIKEIEKFFDPLCKAAHAAHKALTSKKKEALEKPTQAKAALGKAVVAYEEEVERKRKAEEDRLRREAEEEERKKKEAREAEEAKKVEEAAAKGETYVPEEPEIEEEETVIEDIVVKPSIQKSGSSRKNWKGEVVDMDAFIAACVSSGRLEFLMVNQSELNGYAKKMKERAKFSGVKFSSTTTKVF